MTDLDIDCVRTFQVPQNLKQSKRGYMATDRGRTSSRPYKATAGNRHGAIAIRVNKSKTPTLFIDSTRVPRELQRNIAKNWLNPAPTT